VRPGAAHDTTITLLAGERSALAARVARADEARAAATREQERIAAIEQRRRAEAAAADLAERKRREAEWLASLPAGRRLIEQARSHPRVLSALLRLSMAAAAVVVVAAALKLAPVPAGIAAFAYLIGTALVSSILRRRAQRLTPEHLDMLQAQLTRVQATLRDR
jgi:Flp pilus assembly protein TadB